MLPPDADAPPDPQSLQILVQDGPLVIVSKPPGMAVHRGTHSVRGERYVLQTLSAQLDQHVFPVHRLDRGTSGILLFTTDSEAVSPYQDALSAASKRYLAFIRGQPAGDFGSDRALTSQRGVKQPAESQFRILGQCDHGTLVEATITTGRKHQIRRHLNHLGHHVAGDTTHGKGPFNRRLRSECGLPRLFLHAFALGLDDPLTKARRELRDPLPPDLVAVLDRMPGLAPAFPEGAR